MVFQEDVPMQYEVTNLMEQVIQDHPFKSPLIPFSSHLLDPLENQDMKRTLPKQENLSNVSYDTSDLKKKIHEKLFLGFI